MNRIERTMRGLAEAGKKAFIPYITAGDPDSRMTVKIADSLIAGGADLIELGIPFSDPLADGPTIQRAVERSLGSGFHVRDIFRIVSDLRQRTEVPLLFMTYYNIVFSYGPEKFIKDSRGSGADGMIIPDLPMEEAGEVIRICDKYDFTLVMLVSPMTPDERFRKIARISRGFIYYVSLTGVTGARKKLPGTVSREVAHLKKLTDVPVCVGFGISGAPQASQISSRADGVIIGSAIINIIEKYGGNEKILLSEIRKFASGISAAVH